MALLRQCSSGLSRSEAIASLTTAWTFTWVGCPHRPEGCRTALSATRRAPAQIRSAAPCDRLRPASQPEAEPGRNRLHAESVTLPAHAQDRLRGQLSALIAMTVPVPARHEPWTLAVTTEVPGIVALEMVRSGRRHDLRGVPSGQYGE